LDWPRIILERAQKLAESKGWRCLSSPEDYVNAESRLRWLCEHGHELKLSYLSVKKKGSGCKYCAGNARHTIEDAQELAKQKFKGICLSSEYKNAQSKMWWQCACDHQPWEATYFAVQQGEIPCPECRKQARSVLKQAQLLAKSRGGKCLAPEGSYLRKDHITQWVCGKGHTPWPARLSSLIRGTWCPDCSSSYGERAVKIILEQLFGVPFPRTKSFPFLVNSRGNRMEVDGRAEVQGQCLCFEFHGEYHWKEDALRFKPQDKTGVFNLERRRQDDATKRRLAAEHGLVLIEIYNVWAIDELPKVIYNMVSGLGFKPLISVDEVDLSGLYYSVGWTREEMLQGLRDYYEEYGASPKMSDWNKCRKTQVNWPGADTLCARFGGWPRALQKAGLPSNTHLTYTDEDLLTSLQDFERTNGCSPSCRAWETHARDNPAVAERSAFIHRFGSWNKALHQAGLKITVQSARCTLTDREMVDVFRVWLGNPEIKANYTWWRKNAKRVGLFSVDVIMTRFGSWAKFKEAAQKTT